MAGTPLTPEQRSLRSRIGGYARAAKYDGIEVTAKARETFLDRFVDAVDPDRELDAVERQRRADAARKAYMTSLAFKSARARRARREAS